MAVGQKQQALVDLPTMFKLHVLAPGFDPCPNHLRKQRALGHVASFFSGAVPAALRRR